MGEMRDVRKSKDYFEAYIACENRRLEEGLNRLRFCQDKEKAARIWGSILLYRMNLLIASFSRGAERDQLEALYEKACQAALEARRLTYANALALSSFGVILNGAPAVRQVIGKYEAVFASDKLLAGLSSYLLQGKAVWQGAYSFPEVYGGLDEVLSAATKPAGEDALLAWLDTWYDNCGECAWHGALDSGNDVYYGYWCLEGAAVAAILGLDGNRLAQNEYFPVL